jgi:hypothetical protein
VQSAGIFEFNPVRIKAAVGIHLGLADVTKAYSPAYALKKVTLIETLAPGVGRSLNKQMVCWYYHLCQDGFSLRLIRSGHRDYAENQAFE